MAECSIHPGNMLPGCYWCRTGTEPGSAFIPPSQADLEAETEKALTAARSLAVQREHAGGFPSGAELDGIAALLAVQFPAVPAAVLGRVLVSAAMAAGSVVKAVEITGVVTGRRPLNGNDVVELLAMAGARLAGEEVPGA